jgi:hypothetical protein
MMVRIAQFACSACGHVLSYALRIVKVMTAISLAK